MPLKESASKKAFGENVKAEEDAGKPEKQAVAIAYSEKAKAEGVRHAAAGDVVPGAVDPDPFGLQAALGAGPSAFDQKAAADAAAQRQSLAVEGETPDGFMIRRGDGARSNLPKAGLSPAVQAALRQSMNAAAPVPAGALAGVAMAEPQHEAPPANAAPTGAADESDAEAGAGEAEQEEDAKAAGVSPVDLSGLDRAEGRVEAANNASADLSSLDAPLAAQDAALTHEQDVATQAGDREAGVSTELAGKLGEVDAQAKAREAAFEKEWQPKFDEFKNSKVDPQQLWKKLGFGSKVMVTIGRVLGAFAAGYGKVPDEANAIINNAIDQNIQAQRSNIALQGQALEFQRQHNMDQAQFEALSRLSMREEYGAKLDAVRSKDLSEEKSAGIDALKANNGVAIAQLKHQLASTAGQQNAAANYSLEASKAQLGAAAAAGAGAKPGKPEDIDKVNKSTVARQALDNLSVQIGKGWQATVPWLAPLSRAASHVPGSETQNALAERDKVAGMIAAGLYSDQQRMANPELVKQLADQLPSPMKTDEQNSRDYLQLDALLDSQRKAHWLAAYGGAPPENDRYALSPTGVSLGKGGGQQVGAPSSSHVRLLNPKGERVLMPAAIAQKAVASGLYKPAP